MLLVGISLLWVDISGCKGPESLGKLTFVTGEGERGRNGDTILAVISWHFSQKLTCISPQLH